jgi:hypothetical protein
MGFFIITAGESGEAHGREWPLLFFNSSEILNRHAREAASMITSQAVSQFPPSCTRTETDRADGVCFLDYCRTGVRSTSMELTTPMSWVINIRRVSIKVIVS